MRFKMTVGAPVLASAVTAVALLFAVAFSALAGGTTPRTHLTAYVGHHPHGVGRGIACREPGLVGHYACYGSRLGDKPAHHVVQGKGNPEPDNGDNFSRIDNVELHSDGMVIHQVRQIIRRDVRIVRAVGPQNKFLTDAKVRS
jgi:hypothetical protein